MWQPGASERNPNRPVIRHQGPCGERRYCARPACRDEFGIYPTVEFLPNGAIIAYCHGVTYGGTADLSYRIEVSRFGGTMS